ncbi:MAG TPA: penicillin-insensitive murein endopeptidase, partial [Polyangiaceae bacterium]|nr:penicillin-insensitive murein endopeptidase [Polyangiaceae bacterium]
MHRAVRPWGACLVLAGCLVGLSGCAEVHPPVAVAPDAAASDPGAQRSNGSADTSLAGSSAPAAASPFDVPADATVAWEGTPDDDEEAADEGGEDDHDENAESPDVTACLDRGPSSPPHCAAFQFTSPLQGLSDADVQKKVKGDLSSLGSISIGAPNRGRLINGVRFPDGEHWKLTDPGNAYGTQETVDSIQKAIAKVDDKFPNSPPVIIGHISAKNGGRLRPHKSHQAGRDVDLSYFYTGNVGWYAVATEKNLDRARTWAFVKAFVEDPNVEMVLMDTSIQRLLRDYALQKGEDRAFVDQVFQVSGKNPRSIVRYAHGHDTHIHVRFFSPAAQATAHLAAAYLPKPPPLPARHDSRPGKQLAKEGHGSKRGDDDYILHRARSGDTLDSLARRYGCTVAEIKEANGLKSTSLKE